jgi:hypothetical protein
MIQEQTEAISSFVPYLYFREETNQKINDEFIEPKVKKFFDAQKIDKYHPIDAEKYISDLDFKEVKFSYFYEEILYDIKKEGKIIHEVKYCITLDEKVTNKTCEITKIKYDEILLNKKPIFYFIYIDFKEIMDFARDKKNSAQHQLKFNLH